MKLKTLLLLQCFYFFLGLGFNILNYFHIQSGGFPYSPTPPLLGGITMCLYGLSLLTGYFLFIKFYRVLMVVSVLVLGIYAVGTNLLNYSQMDTLYFSWITYMAGTGMNAFGMILNLLAALKRFEK